MKAVVIDEWGGAPAMKDIPVPERDPGERLIKIQSAGVSSFDEKVRTGGLAQAPHQFPYTLTRHWAGFGVDRVNRRQPSGLGKWTKR